MISVDDRTAIRVWAEGHPQIEEVWLYGSRARGNQRHDSDIDLAIVMDLVEWFDWIRIFRERPDLHLQHPVDLKWYRPEATDLERVGSGVRQSGVLLYKRQADDQRLSYQSCS